MLATKERILIVEDEPGVALLEKRRLERAGFAVVLAGTTEEARRAIEQGDLALMILDYRLGDVDGLDFYAQLKTAGVKLPVILVTGFSSEKTAIQALRVGVREFVTKSPEYLDYLPEAVKNVLHQVQLEHRLEESEHRYRELLENAIDMIQNVSPDGRLLFANHSWRETLGFDFGDLPRLRFADWIDSSSLKKCEEAFEQARKGERVRNVEATFLTKKGKQVFVEGNVNGFFQEGKVVFTLGIFHDVTEKKNLQAQFFRAQRMESIGTLAGGVAHDLNNILTPVLMGVELLRRPLPNADRESVLNTIQTSVQRGTDLIKQILTFARGAEGERIPLQLRHIVNDLEKMIRHTFPKNIDVQAELPRDLLVLPGDATQLYQVLMNLCVNARDAMPHGGVLTIRAENQRLDAELANMHLGARPGPYVALTVSDTGTGISPDILDKIFDPFFTTKEHGKGTGLGLSTVVGIVKSHGGFISVDSQVGKGTRFVLYFPALEADAAKSKEASSSKMLRGKGELVLVIDDEHSIREVTRQALVTYGYKVLAAPDGNIATSLLAQHLADVRVVITDMMMPVMDGPATIRALHRLRPGLPIIAISGMLASSSERTADLEVRAYLRKPFHVDELLKILREVLDAREGRSDAAYAGAESI